MSILPIINFSPICSSKTQNKGFAPVKIYNPLISDTVSFTGKPIALLDETFPVLQKTFQRLPKLMDNFLAYVIKKPAESFQVAKMKEIPLTEYKAIQHSNNPHAPILKASGREYWFEFWKDTNSEGFFADKTGKHVLAETFEGTDLVDIVKCFNWIKGEQPARASLMYADNGDLIYAGFNANSKEINARFNGGKLTNIDILSSTQKTYLKATFEKNGELVSGQYYKYEKDQRGNLISRTEIFNGEHSVVDFDPYGDITFPRYYDKNNKLVKKPSVPSSNETELFYMSSWSRLDETLHRDLMGG